MPKRMSIIDPRMESIIWNRLHMRRCVGSSPNVLVAPQTILRMAMQRQWTQEDEDKHPRDEKGRWADKQASDYATEDFAATDHFREVMHKRFLAKAVKPLKKGGYAKKAWDKAITDEMIQAAPRLGFDADFTPDKILSVEDAAKIGAAAERAARVINGEEAKHVIATGAIQGGAAAVKKAKDALAKAVKSGAGEEVIANLQSKLEQAEKDQYPRVNVNDCSQHLHDSSAKIIPLGTPAQSKAGRENNFGLTKSMIDHISEQMAQEYELSTKLSKNAEGWYLHTLSEMARTMASLHPEINVFEFYGGRLEDMDDYFTSDEPDEESRERYQQFCAFRLALAITSNGMPVDKNLQLAEIAYSGWKENVKKGVYQFDVTEGFHAMLPGSRANAIAGHLLLANKLIASMGQKDDGTIDYKKGLGEFVKFLSTPGIVGDINRELKDMGFDPTKVNIGGELIDTSSKGAMIFGPKLGSFYGNLGGDLSTVTMDRWFMRTFGRMNGQLMTVNSDLLSKQIFGGKEDDLSESDEDDEGNDKYKSSEEGIIRLLKAAKPEELLGKEFWGKHKPPAKGWTAAAKRAVLTKAFKSMASRAESGEVDYRDGSLVMDWMRAKYKAYADSPGVKTKGFGDKTDLNKANKQAWLHLTGSNDAPFNGTHREQMRTIVKDAIGKIKKRTGRDVPVAVFQAGLWYLEKEMYLGLGGTKGRSSPTDYMEASARLVNRAKAVDTTGSESAVVKIMRHEMKKKVADAVRESQRNVTNKEESLAKAKATKDEKKILRAEKLLKSARAKLKKDEANVGEAEKEMKRWSSRNPFTGEEPKKKKKKAA